MTKEVHSSTGAVGSRSGPPWWLIAATVGLTVLMLYMAVAETAAWTHYFIDQGEYIALIGLAFAAGAGAYLYRCRRLAASLPLFLPWFLYPVVTQGDQLIDNMTIQQMRIVVHLILGFIFAAPVAMVVLAATQLLSPPESGIRSLRSWTGAVPGLRLIEQGKTVEGGLLLAFLLILIEVWVAHVYLGTLMVATLLAGGMAVLIMASIAGSRAGDRRRSPGAAGERVALALLVGGLALSSGLYLFYRNLPTSQQGTVAGSAAVERGIYRPDGRIVPVDDPAIPDPDTAARAEAVLASYCRAIDGLFRAYYRLDRNYNYWFHNELFMRQTPVEHDFRRRALESIDRMRALAAAATRALEEIEPRLPADGGVAAFLTEVRRFAEHNFDRADELARMSAEFERTRAGLQHATHLYEGEAKALGIVLMEVLDKHRGVMGSERLAELRGPFVEASHEIHEAYANRIVGF